MLSIFDRFKKQEQNSAGLAKDRLQIVVAHERRQRDQPSYLPKLQSELIEVIKKYIEIDMSDVVVDISQEDYTSILEVNITLPS